uniref:Uncharacterized protein n=1 Tax=Aegilops tauschii subsp. strangulata TaxID=200361 RepID=A0A453NJU9_AEGTS
KNNALGLQAAVDRNCCIMHGLIVAVEPFQSDCTGSRRIRCTLILIIK